MAKDLVLNIEAQKSIYTKKEGNNNRTIDVYYSIPENGVNEDTGIMLYIFGFRGNPKTKVGKKLRNYAADKYNLITIQCDYFGNEYMQKSKNLRLLEEHMNNFSKEELIKIYKDGIFNYDNFIEICRNYNLTTKIRENLNETIESFNEMGLMQAMDNLNSIISIIELFKKAGQNLNYKKIILFGNSHGAYLCHLCNILSGGLVNLIIDNSGWMYPTHIGKDKRILAIDPSNRKMKVVFDYKAREYIEDFEILNLNNLYSQINNKADIVCYNGTNDHLVNIDEKKKFIEKLPNSKFYEINDNNIDGVIFQNNKHGLGANFLKLFDEVMNEYEIRFEKDNDFPIMDNIYFSSDRYHYIVDYRGDIPRLTRAKKH